MINIILCNDPNSSCNLCEESPTILIEMLNKNKPENNTNIKLCTTHINELFGELDFAIEDFGLDEEIDPYNIDSYDFVGGFPGEDDEPDITSDNTNEPPTIENIEDDDGLAIHSKIFKIEDPI